MRNIFQVLSLFIALLLAGCGGGGGSSGSNPNQSQLLTTAGAAVILPVGAANEYQISGGVPPYRIGSPDRAIAVGAVNGNTLTIGAVAAGTTTITILDYSGASVSVAVTVGSSTALFTTAPDSLTIGVGSVAARTFSIGGGAAPYSIENSAINVATVTRVGSDKFTVTGIAIGDSSIKIRDAAGAVLTVAVTVGAPVLRVSLSTLTTFPGLKAFAKISGGQPPYIVAGNIPAAISATIVGDVLEITGNLAATDLDVVVADATGQTVKVTVTVEIGQATFGFSPGAISVSENDNQPINFTLYGAAAGEVCLFTSNSAVLMPTTPNCTTSRNITVDTGTSGSRCVSANQTVTITAVDSARAVAKTTITILDNGKVCEGVSTSLLVTPSSLTIAAGETTASAAVTGGDGTYIVASNKPSIATATIAANVLTVTRTGAATGDAEITVREVSNPTRVITVKVTVN